MNGDINEALILLVVGMVTVFSILALIVVLGNILIKIINKYFPEKEIPAVVKKVSQGVIDPKKMAAIVSAVDIITQGKGKVTSVKKAK